MSTHPPIDPRNRQARWAVLAAFMINGIAAGAWLPHMPEMMGRHGLSGLGLGGVMFLFAGGSLLFMPVAAAIMARVGSRLPTIVSALAIGPLMALTILMPSLILFAAGVGVFGLITGLNDVSMNAHAVSVEIRAERPIMSSFHALYSVGGLVGAGSNGLFMELGATPAVHVLCVAGATLVLAAVLSPFLLGRGDEPARAQAVAARPPALAGLQNLRRLWPGLLAMALLVLAVVQVVTEAAVETWSGIFMEQIHAARPGFVAAAFASYAAAMAIGRFTGDRVVARLGHARVVRLGGTLAAAGLALVALSPHPLLACLGFLATGLGLANVFPVLVTAAGALPGRQASTSVAIVTTGSWLGALISPPLIGVLADGGGMRLVTVALALAALYVAWRSRDIRVAVQGEALTPGPDRASRSRGSG